MDCTKAFDELSLCAQSKITGLLLSMISNRPGHFTFSIPFLINFSDRLKL